MTPGQIRTLLKSVVDEYVREVQDNEDPDVTQRTNEDQRIRDFALYLRERAETHT
jgi:hypothetical protein